MAETRKLGLTEVAIALTVIVVLANAVVFLPGWPLRHHGPANESVAISDVRTVISAEAAYSSESGGAYGSLDCLGAPWKGGCIAGYALTRPSFLDPSLADLGAHPEKSSYARSFTPGAPATSAKTPRGLSGYCYEAVPSVPGKTGFRSFAGDASGRVCQDPSGARLCGRGPNPWELPASCTPLQ